MLQLCALAIIFGWTCCCARTFYPQTIFTKEALQEEVYSELGKVIAEFGLFSDGNGVSEAMLKYYLNEL